MSKPAPTELHALLVQLEQSTERTKAALDTALRFIDESEAKRPEREKAARARALAEFEGLDFTAIAGALINDMLKP